MTRNPSNLEIKRTFKCSKRRLFDAWCKPSIMSKWFFADSNRCKDSDVECDFRVDGSYSLVMYFEDGGSSKMWGTYKEILRYTFMAFTWNSVNATDSLVELNFKELSPNRTELTLVHKLLPDDESKSLHNHGWELCLANLGVFVEAQQE
ncbi:MAG: SRPBCC domain-containing protein [Pseudomonadota bacterium]